MPSPVAVSSLWPWTHGPWSTGFFRPRGLDNWPKHGKIWSVLKNMVNIEGGYPPGFQRREEFRQWHVKKDQRIEGDLILSRT